MFVQNSNVYREIYYSCVEGIFIVKGGVIIKANPQFGELFGYEANEIIGLKVEELVPSNLRGNHVHLREEYTRAPVSKQMGVGRDLLALRKDGSTFPIEISLNPANIDGEDVVIAQVIDITVRKKVELDLKNSEEQLIRYAAELERRVEERTKELADVVTDLKKTNIHLEAEIRERVKAEEEAKKALHKEKELNEMKSRFVSMASHEFRTPLSTILSSAALIAKYATTDTQDKRDKHISRIKSNVSELTSILNEFLSLEKIDAGKMRIELIAVEINALLSGLISDLSTVTKVNQTIDWVETGGECILKTDPQMLRQVVTNLVSNAIKYSEEDSIIRVALTQDDTTVCITVTDQGMGIPLNDQKHLFEKFFRAHNSHHIQGTGLGLNIVRKYVDLLEGEIAFESVEGEGAKFEVILKKN
ncbi:hypothetical protein BFP72_08355 [Reichenbachiella sp. 5M10]|nr:hypothetical protein BFP72_08355 [Reichenbachiella sp. 5M10]